MVNDEIFVEKCCSRCDRISWDSMVGFYNENCTKRGRLGVIQSCNILGRRMETDNSGKVHMFDKDGNDITSPDTNVGEN